MRLTIMLLPFFKEHNYAIVERAKRETLTKKFTIMKTIDYANFTQEQLEKEFSTSCVRGLSNNQVLAYRKGYGINELQGQEISWGTLLSRQFKSPFIYLLLAAAILSFFLGDPVNGFTISFIILLNGFLSFYQEYKAEQAVKLLQTHVTMKATVIREGITRVIDSKELVPGDVVLLQTGTYIPADIILCQGSLTVNESVLTGESMPVKKTVSSWQEGEEASSTARVCFLSTTVVDGAARGIVVTTGNNTMFGAIGKLTLETIQESGFQERIARLSKFILLITLVSLTCLFLFHFLIKGRKTDVIQLALFALALTLGLTPEALPTVITFALSRGALLLVRNHVVVKRLSAIEDLGAITMLCFDKTGTLTENKLSVKAVYEEQPDTVLRFMYCATQLSSSTDPFDTALREKASSEVGEKDSYKLIKEIPFNPAVRRSAVVLEKNGSTLLIVKGAFESIASISKPLSDAEELKRWIQEQAQQGNRILAVAYKESPTYDDPLEEKELTFAGLVAFYDPLKSTTPSAILKAKKLGIDLKMLTGDSPESARAVAHQIQLEEETITGPAFEELSLEEKKKAVKQYTVFARILPQQKHEIVTLLKENYVVGFVGEGINDAPALKAAHVGLVVKGAQDIAQDTADIILLNKSLFAIIQGIGIGRTIFSNTMKYLLATLSSNFGNCYSLAIASLLIDFLPLLPLQILLINLLSDFPMVAIATDTVDYDELSRPQAYNFSSLAITATILGITSSCFDFMTFALFSRKGASVLQTNWFIESILTEIVLIYSVRTKKPFYKAARPSFMLLGTSLLSSIITIVLPLTSVGQRLFKFQAPTTSDLVILLTIVLAYFSTTELVKTLYFRSRERVKAPAKKETG